MSPAAIEIDSVTKSFRRARGWRDMVRGSTPPRKQALRGVSLSVTRGEIFGLLGPNGAGKTTLMKILTGLILPDSGQLFINGLSLTGSPRGGLNSINMVYSDERSFYWRLSLLENLRFYGRLFGLRGGDAETRIGELIELVGLSAEAGKRMQSFSSGMKQRAAIARGLINDPEIVLMDEPSRTLDPLGADDLHRLIQERVLDGRRTVVIATNHMNEAEALCNRLTLIDEGVNVLTGTVAELRKRANDDLVYRLHVAADGTAWQPAIAAIPGVLRVGCERAGSGLYDLEVVIAPHSSALALLIRHLVERSIDIRSCAKQDASLDQIFRHVVRQRHPARLEAAAR